MGYAVAFIAGILTLAFIIFICWAFSKPMSSGGR